MNKQFTKRIFGLVCGLCMASMAFVGCQNNAESFTQEDIVFLQARYDSLMVEYELLKNSNPEFGGQTATQDSIIQAQAAEIDSLLTQLKEQQAKKPAAKPANDNNNGGDAALRQQLKEKESTIKRLQSQLDKQAQDLRKAQKDLSAGRNVDCSELSRQIASQQSVIDGLEGQVRTLNSKNKAMTATNTELNNQVQSLNGTNAQLNKQVRELESQLAAAQNSVRSNNQASSQCESQVQSLNGQIQQLNTRISEKEALISNMEKQIASLKAAKNKGEMSESEMVQKIDKLGVQVKVFESQVAKLESQVSDLSKQLAEAEKREAAANQAAAKAEQDAAALSAKLEQVHGQLASTRSELADAKKQLAAYEKNKSNNASNGSDAQLIADLQAQVASQQARIEQLSDQLASKEIELANTKKSVSKATVNEKLNQLQALCDSYAAEIERLRAENASLRAENAELKSQISASATSSAENERLEQKIRLASVLIAAEMRAVPGRSMASANLVRPTSKASKTAVVHITGQIMRNNVVDPGSMTIYARIATANNRVVSFGNAETFTSAEGTEIQYSMKQDIEYTGMERPINMVWKKNQAMELQPGLYWVTLYCNGYEIGKTSFTLE